MPSNRMSHRVESDAGDLKITKAARFFLLQSSAEGKKIWTCRDPDYIQRSICPKNFTPESFRIKKSDAI